MIPAPLLSPDEPPAFTTLRAGGTSPWLIVCDHASARIPLGLGWLGLGPAALSRHIASDLGAEATAQALSARLDACLIAQNYSRLAIDCNRPPGAPDSIATISDGTPIPGNLGLSAAEAQLRQQALFDPYHAEIARQLDARQRSGRPSLLLALHSFTPVYGKLARPWHVGIMYNRDARLAKALLSHLRRDPGLVVGDNEPYSVSDESDYTIPVHGEQRGIPSLAIELRQDLLLEAAGPGLWAETLARQLQAIARELGLLDFR